MIVRKAGVSKVNWGSGTSERYLVKDDGFGFGLNYTVIHAGTRSRLQYNNHIEAVYCVSGMMFVHDRDTDELHTIEPGTMYVLDKHDAHTLIASDYTDCEVVCIFTPGLVGDEVHSLSADGYSGF